MTADLRQAWANLVRADDYETHMAAVGQAQANAQLVQDYFHRARLVSGARVLFVGAGTGQMFDYVCPSFLQPYRLTFSDLNPGYLTRLKERLDPYPLLRFEIIADDIERSRLNTGYTAILAVLLLEHVDWHKAIATLCSFSPANIFLIIQQNPASGAAALTASPGVPGTMNVFRDLHPALVPREELLGELLRQGFVCSYAAERTVADRKKMLALGFERHRIS